VNAYRVAGFFLTHSVVVAVIVGPSCRCYWLSVHSLKTDESIVTDAVVRYDGSVTWIRPVIYTVTSRHEFRGNSWSATLKFASWTYDATLLDLQPLASSSIGRRRGRALSNNEVDSEPVRMDTSSFEPSDLWGLLDNRGRLEASIEYNLPRSFRVGHGSILLYAIQLNPQTH